MSQNNHLSSQGLAGRLAALVYTGVQCFQRVCEGELNFALWRKLVKDHLVDQELSASDDELAWLQSSLSTEPELKAFTSDARERLNARLKREPALAAGDIIALFMDRSIDENETTLRPLDLGEPTALIELREPLHFACHRGDIFQIVEAQVVAKMHVRSIPGALGTPTEEAERFVLKSSDDITMDGTFIHLRYPSLNKVVPGILSRRHLGEGKQNTNRSIYYHAAYQTVGSNGKMEYRTLWSIRDEMIQQTWKCPSPPTLRRPSTLIDTSAELPGMER